MPLVRFLLPVILLIAFWTDSSARTPRGTGGHATGCAGKLAPLSAAEMETLVTGKTMTFAWQTGVCLRSIWFGSYWSIEFRADGTAIRRFDRGVHADGRYFTRRGGSDGDRLCIASILEMATWEGPNRPPHPYFSASTDCLKLYRDRTNRLYLAGVGVPSPEPVMVQLRPIG